MLRKAMVVVALFGVMASQVQAGPIYLDSIGREWLDVNLTSYRSWNDTAAVCDSLNGGCAGVLATNSAFSGDVDVSGYQWATRDEVRELFYEVAGLSPGALDGYSAAFPSGDGFGSAAFGIFDPTLQLPEGPGTLNIYNGLTRDTYLGLDGLQYGISGIVESSPFAGDHFTLTGGLATDVREMSSGVFLYRAVPEPGTWALFLTALAGVLLVHGSARRDAGRRPLGVSLSAQPR